MAETKELSVERQRFLLEMGTALMEVESGGGSIDSDGVVIGSAGKWVPVENPAPMEGLFQAMRLVGLDPTQHKFQQYHVMASNPYHGGRIDLPFPDQMVVKSDRYLGLHQVSLVVKHPMVAAVEIKSYGRR